MMKLEIKLNQEQFDLLITSLVQIAQGCVRMADAWDGKPKQNKNIESTYLDKGDKKKISYPRRFRSPTIKGDVCAKTVMSKVGMKESSSLFRAACAACGVRPFYHGDGGRLFIKKEDVPVVSKSLIRFK